MNREFVNKPWGSYDRFTWKENSTVKILTINPKSKLSLQLHHKRDEFWKIVKGSCTIIINDDIFNANEGDEFQIPRKTLHRIIGTDNQAKVLEISVGDFDENDIERIEDEYDRI